MLDSWPRGCPRGVATVYRMVQGWGRGFTRTPLSRQPLSSPECSVQQAGYMDLGMKADR